MIILAYQDSVDMDISCSSEKDSLTGNSLDGILMISDKWSATVFSIPFLSLISRSNS